jgi:fumarate reductase flavoprotein subunit
MNAIHERETGILPAAGKHFEVSVPVIVIGGGACGLTAALAVRDAGAEVMVLERGATPLGSTSMSQGMIMAAGTKEQAKHGQADSPDQLYEDILAKARGQTDPALARLVADNAGKTVDWLTENHGVILTFDPDWKGLGHTNRRLHGPPSRTGNELLGMLIRANEDAGTTLLTNTRVTHLFADPDGRVRGVKILRPDGGEDEIGCEAVILATCGFGGNKAMVERYMPNEAHLVYHGWEYNEGDGIRWGMALGGAVADMGAFQALGSLAEPHRVLINYQPLIEGGVMINTNGERFSHELENVSGQGIVVAAQPGRIAWIVYGQHQHEFSKDLYEYKEASGVGAIRKAESIEALAQIIGAPVETLSATLAQVSDFANARATDPFGRSFDAKSDFGLPLYAARVTGALFHTQGGLEVDAHAQVKKREGGVLPNLFAGGGAARSISGPSYWGYLPAAGICMAVTLGRIAGTHAAALALSAVDKG